jgi:hypothetical protein
MKVVRNTTHAPLKVPLGAGRFLHLGPGKSGSVADDAPKAPAVARMIKARKLEVVGAGDDSVESADTGPAPREIAHGRSHQTRIVPRGNRGG